MDTLYILGNGFDLAHDLPTKYWDFRKYLEENYYEFLSVFENLYDIQRLDETEYGYSSELQEKWDEMVKETLWSNMERAIGLPNTQTMLSISDSVLENLELETGNIAIKDTMDEYWKDMYGFINKLQEYVRDWISEIDIDGIEPKSKELLSGNAYFFTFNYTEVLEKVYGIDSVLHIHGSVGENAIFSPVMGHCNKAEIDKHKQKAKEADEGFDEGGASIHEAIANYLETIYKDTNDHMFFHQYFFNKLHAVKNIIIMGWSGGEVDIPYLEKIRDSVSNDAKWEVYYYDDTALNSLRAAFQETNIINNYKTEFLDSKKFWKR